MNIYECGTKVNLLGVEGTIVQVSIKYGLVMYEIMYFVDCEENKVWLHESQFSTESHRVKIGFK